MTSSSSAFKCGQMASKVNNFKKLFFRVFKRFRSQFRLVHTLAVDGPFRAIISNAHKMESVQLLGQAISVNDNMQKK